MTTSDKVIPVDSSPFFEALEEVFERYPEMKGEYAVASMELAKRMGIDYRRKAGLSRIEGDQIITRFVDCDDLEPDSQERARICLLYSFDYRKCLHWMEARL